MLIINWKANVVSKKGWKWANDSRRLFISPGRGPGQSCLILNSIPKSGTHLLYQVLKPLTLNDFGGFLATTPSVSLKRRSPAEHIYYLERLFNRELISAHMHFDVSVASTIDRLERPMITIIRDPRDVFISELDYLSEVNRWHRMHRYYRKVTNFESAFSLCLEGLPQAPFCYPSFAERIKPYLGWLEDPSTLIVRFDQLRNENTQLNEMIRIVRYLGEVGLWLDDEATFIERARDSIDPTASHTFRQGGVGSWRERLSGEQAEQLEGMISPLASVMGYP